MPGAGNVTRPIACRGALVSIVNVVETGVAPGVTDAGANVHVDSAGSPEHAKLTA